MAVFDLKLWLIVIRNVFPCGEEHLPLCGWGDTITGWVHKQSTHRYMHSMRTTGFVVKIHVHTAVKARITAMQLVLHTILILERYRNTTKYNTPFYYYLYFKKSVVSEWESYYKLRQQSRAVCSTPLHSLSCRFHGDKNRATSGSTSGLTDVHSLLPKQTHKAKYGIISLT